MNKTSRKQPAPDSMNSPDRRRWRPAVLTAVAAAVVVAALSAAVRLGCTTRPDGDYGEPVSGGAGSSRGDHFTRAMNLLGRLDEFDQEHASPGILYHLNRWIKDQPQDDEWMIDPLHAQLPAKFDQVKVTGALPLLRFQAHDFYFLREAVWMRDISRSVVAREKQRLRRAPNGAKADRPAHQPRPLGEKGAADLRVARWLFDWTVRNIQLDPVSAPGSHHVKYHAWESLLLGHGDSLQRARIFILLLRQQGIDAVMLALPDPSQESPRPWLPAVLVGGRLYLFDTALGLPIPALDGRGVATLRQVRADPALLRALDLDEEHPYEVTGADVQHVLALIDATPASLSQRMKLVQAELSGPDRMVLVVEPSLLARRLQACEGVAGVKLWTLPYEAFLLRRTLLDDPKALEAMSLELGVFDKQSALFQGRLLQFRGEFDAHGQRRGAKQYFLECRPPDRQISQLKEFIEKFGQLRTLLALGDDLPGTPAKLGKALRSMKQSVVKIEQSEELQRQLTREKKLPDDPVERAESLKSLRQWLDRINGSAELRTLFALQQGLPRNPAKRIEALGRLRERLVRTKQDASYWLGLIAAEDGRYEVAVDYFDRRTLQASPDGPWTDGARYNLARAYEALGELEKARRLYQADDSPQRHGNRLRARRLDISRTSFQKNDSR